MRVWDIMRRPVVSVRSSDSAHQAAVLLTEHGYAALPVLDGEHAVVGMVSGGDLLRAQVELRAVTVAEVMSAPAVALLHDQEFPEAVRLLVASGRRSLPVLDDEAGLLGILSRGDLLRIVLTPDGILQARAQAILDGYTGTPRWHATVTDAAVIVHGPFTDEAERRLALALARTVPGIRTASLGSTLHPYGQSGQYPAEVAP
ncbi:CBS domain-containing protein [Actinopolyspora mzabensis]|uniref:CBS domain-containing protein n=1 Tax=Actinopolyspora mzabensis TaxID=995066 RepID=A0A1G8Y856_ACTMZ|nr:CBS domain-containing protein [Actinopolyspora mzabensis]SDJ98978.1 CBS domain-containing protein [Actinopolyspora mzabensis]